jgi:uncharacterized protein
MRAISGSQLEEATMSFTLYDATIPNFQQTLGATIGLMDKAEAFCADTGLDPAALVDAKLADDMLPFGYQVKSVCAHSIGAIKGVRAGVFSPDLTPWPTDLAGLKAALTNAHGELENISPDEVNGFVGNDMAFAFKDRRMEFTAEDFLMSFSLPNFYFHASTAYAIMRMKGVQIGKMDFMGRPRLKA